MHEQTSNSQDSSSSPENELLRAKQLDKDLLRAKRLRLVVVLLGLAWLVGVVGASYFFYRSQVKFETANAKIEALLNSPAAFYKCTEEHMSFGNDGNGGGKIVNFSQGEYDTHEAVAAGGNWKFKAPKPGIYSVSAHAHYVQEGTGGTALSVYKNGARFVELAALIPPSTVKRSPDPRDPKVPTVFVEGLTIGGTTDISLDQDEFLDIRINTFGEVTSAHVDSQKRNLVFNSLCSAIATKIGVAPQLLFGPPSPASIGRL